MQRRQSLVCVPVGFPLVPSHLHCSYPKIEEMQGSVTTAPLIPLAWLAHQCTVKANSSDTIDHGILFNASPGNNKIFLKSNYWLSVAMWWSTFGILTFPLRCHWESMAQRQTLERIGSNTAATIKWHLIFRERRRNFLLRRTQSDDNRCYSFLLHAGLAVLPAMFTSVQKRLLCSLHTTGGGQLWQIPKQIFLGHRKGTTRELWA